LLKHESVQSSVEGFYTEEKMKKIFESANDCMVFLDRSGRILNVNGKAVQVFGGSKKELRQPLLLSHNSASRSSLSLLSPMMQKTKIHMVELKLTHRWFLNWVKQNFQKKS